MSGASEVNDDDDVEPPDLTETDPLALREMPIKPTAARDPNDPNTADRERTNILSPAEFVAMCDVPASLTPAPIYPLFISKAFAVATITAKC